MAGLTCFEEAADSGNRKPFGSARAPVCCAVVSVSDNGCFSVVVIADTGDAENVCKR